MRVISSTIRGVGLWVGLLAVAGCSSYNAQTESVHHLYETGSLDAAAQEASQKANDAGTHDKLVYLLEDGAIERAAGHLDRSQTAFDYADEMSARFEEEAKTRVSQEALDIAVNPAATDYRGFAYDRIMMNTYKALDALEAGDLDRARVELTRAYERQQDAVAANQKDIADAQQAAQKNQQFDASAASNDPQFQQNFNQQYSDLNVQDLSGYTNYVNPFTEYLRGVYFMTDGADASDFEQGAAILRRVAGMLKDNPYIQQDAVLADQIAGGHKQTPTTYVILEAGLAPDRQQVKIGFPLILRGGTSQGTYQIVEAAFPKLVIHDSTRQQVTVQTSGGNFPTAVVCNMDKVVEQEFRNELPATITKALVSAAVKAIAQYETERAADKSGNVFASLGTAVGTAVYVQGSTEADTRAWRSLPKTFSLARFATPSDRNITLLFPDGQQVGPIHLQDGQVNFVYVKSVDSWPAPIVRQFKLK
jgi:hypothetical protein